jgi:rhamnulokinase
MGRFKHHDSEECKTMSQQTYLAVDLGAESGRVMAGQFDGKQMQLRQLHRFPNGGVSIGGTLRWNVVQLWSEIQTGLNLAATEFGDSIVSVGVDTWGVDFVLLNENDELLGLPYHYRDDRTKGMLNAAISAVPRSEIFAATGLQFMEINSLYQLMAMHEKNPGLMEQASWFLMMPDFFHWCLCGSRVVEFTNATTTQMLHPTQRNWSVDLLRKLRLPTDIFPEIVEPGTLLGNLRPEVAQATGLGRIKVVTPATHDTAAAVAAVPTANTGQANWAYISSGTWSLMGVEIQDAVFTDRALELNVTNEGGIDGTFRLLKNIMGLWLVQQSRRSFARQGHEFDYSQMAALAESAAPFVSLVDPDHEQFLKPDCMASAIGQRCRETSQPVPESPGAVIRCALESLALKYRMVLGWLEELTGTKVEVIHIVGGGTQNRLLNQFTANACQVPVITGPIEATALGNVLVQARSSGEISSLSDLRQVASASSEIERYEPEMSGEWTAAWERFQQLG